jgi:hypothetical protein
MVGAWELMMLSVNQIVWGQMTVVLGDSVCIGTYTPLGFEYK